MASYKILFKAEWTSSLKSLSWKWALFNWVKSWQSASPSSFSVWLDDFLEDISHLEGCYWKFPDWFILKNDTHRWTSEPIQVDYAEVFPHAHAGSPPFQDNSKRLWKTLPSFCPIVDLIHLKYSSSILQIALKFYCSCHWHKINKCVWTHYHHFVSSLCQRREEVGSCLLLQEPTSQVCCFPWTCWCTYKFSSKSNKTNTHRQNAVVFPLSHSTVQKEKYHSL